MNLPSQDLQLFWVSNPPRKTIPAIRPSVPRYRVGEPLQHGRRHWPTGTQYIHGCNGHELTLFLPEIDDQVVQDVRTGEGDCRDRQAPSDRAGLSVRSIGSLE